MEIRFIGRDRSIIVWVRVGIIRIRCVIGYKREGSESGQWKQDILEAAGSPIAVLAFTGVVLPLIPIHIFTDKHRHLIRSDV
ncbi:hypothetical protein D479_08776, partial [Halobacillus sp. BAB-2008]